MPLQKQNININFAQGLDLKTDPFQVPAGKFLSLKNSVFDTAGRLTKRNGYQMLASLPDASSKYLTTFNNNLTAIGTQLEAFIEGTSEWVNKGNIQPVDLTVLPVVRSNTNQIQADVVVSSNNTMCAVYTDNVVTSTGIVPTYKYVIADAITGQNVIAPVTLTTTDLGTPRVFLLGNYFIILYTVKVVSTYHLRYIAVNIYTQSATASTDVASSYIPAASLAFDALTVGSNLYIAYNTTTGGQAVKVTYLTSSLSLVTAKTFASVKAQYFSMSADISVPQSPKIYIITYDSVAPNGDVIIVDQNLNTILAPTSWTTDSGIVNLASTADSGSGTIFYEVNNSYSYDSSIPTHYIKSVTCTQSGTIGTPAVTVRSVGLASKAILYNGISYFLAIYNSVFQPSYYLINQHGQVIAHFAYENGPASYYLYGLPNLLNNNNVLQTPYLFKDLIAAINTTQGAANAAGVYSQTGINLISLNMTPEYITTSEIGQNLNISGGFLTTYDGYSPVEQNFFLWPDNVETSFTADSTVTPTGDTTSGSNIITSMSATTGVAVGMTITGTDIPANSVVTGVLSSTSISISAAATGTATGTTFTIHGNMAAKPDGTTATNAYFYQVLYEWSDNQGNIFRSAPSIPVGVTTTTSGTTSTVTLSGPTLRLTYKINNPVKIVIYRWSVAQQTYHQVTSVLQPLLNDPTVDSWTFVDTQSDTNIAGNSVIYTTGGVLENIAPPASGLLTLFNNRLWVVDSEDRNLLWYSKQVIEATPVEMSDLLTLYVAPSTASEGSTGVITSIAPMDDKLIIFKANALGYINGIGPDNTGANSSYSDFVLINSVVGCTNQQSIVFMPQGLMFQSNKGIWLLGRDLSTTYIGAPVEGLTNGARVLSAINVPATNQVRFTLDTGITLMYDYYYGQWGSFVNIPAVSSTIYNSLHTYINSDGQVFQETVGKYLDNTSPVLMSFTTSWLNLAGVQGFERFYQMYLLGQYYTPFNLSVKIAYNYNPSPIQSTLVSPDNYAPAWGGEALWGSGGAWGGTSATGLEATANVFEARIFPQVQKCESFQISIDEVYDSTFGVAAGQGLTLSGINIVAGLKRGFRTARAGRSFG